MGGGKGDGHGGGGITRSRLFLLLVLVLVLLCVFLPEGQGLLRHLTHARRIQPPERGRDMLLPLLLLLLSDLPLSFLLDSLQ